MSIFSSHKKIFLLGFIVVILVAIPFSVYIAQQRQRATSKASASTTLSFDPSSPIVKVDETLILNIVLDPGTGPSANQVSFAKLSINFDPSKFATVSGSLAPNPNSPNTLTSVLEDPTYESGKASISLSIGADPTKVVATKTKIAILRLKVLSKTDANNPTSITFDITSNNTQVLSIASSDQTSENVLSTSTPATVTINPASAAQPSPTITPTVTPTPLPTTPLLPSSPTPVKIAPTISLDKGTQAAELIPITVTQIPEALPIVQVPEVILPPTGPGEKILVIGILGAIFTIVGGALFILL